MGRLKERKRKSRNVWCEIETMREYQNSRKDNWIEVTDGTWTDEFTYITNELKSIKGCLIRLVNEMKAVYEQNKDDVYIEGTNKKVKR